MRCLTTSKGVITASWATEARAPPIAEALACSAVKEPLFETEAKKDMFVVISTKLSLCIFINGEIECVGRNASRNGHRHPSPQHSEPLAPNRVLYHTEFLELDVMMLENKSGPLKLLF